ncbi:universal stress protein [Vibrio sp. MACH09]|uniref:universal stress protein n=1 Tax=Vibrio sp. MACH09 TaxID=3025122 RepID=UPI00279429E3|nr:universal stress protein [Vibrio sp. MACH09]GLO61515.1 universal stress protein [Vibrio sp. MACH09]
MNYKHILVALELSEDSNLLIDKAVFFAKQFQAEVSFIHIDGTHGEIYPELIDIQKDHNECPVSEHSIEQLQKFERYADYKIKHCFVGTGNLSDKLESTINDSQVDLLICGHHHDFWSKLLSYSKHLINKSPVDILVVPIS